MMHAPELAPLSRRIVGHFIDSMLATSAVLLSLLVVDDPRFALVAAALGGAYILFAEGVGHGQSLGKVAMGIVVVDAVTGKACTVLQSFVRNFSRCFGMLDWAFVLGASAQRLGDMAARTIVIVAPRGAGGHVW